METAKRHNQRAQAVPARTYSNAAPLRCANVLGVSLAAVDLERALGMMEARLQNGAKGYVCFVGVHGILEAMKSKEVADAYEHAAIALPDGTPTVWVGRRQGLKEISHVTGPDLMHEMFRRTRFRGYSHYFYGGKPGVAEELAATLQCECPGTIVAGTFTPPFRDLTAAEEDLLVAEIDRLRPDFVWVGISTPRQDLWMRRMLPRLNTRLVFGVGAAFDFLTGRIQYCPAWVKRAGLHWLHRLAQDPLRLAGRNLHNIPFLWHIALQLTGMRSYPMRPHSVDTDSPSMVVENSA